MLNGDMKMDAVLIHGMGRTPVAMSILAVRLRGNNIRLHLFGYSVTFERWDECIQRFESFIEKRVKTNDYIVIGHSLGTVLTRATLLGLIHKPDACFFLAPPTQVCKAARNFANRRFIELFMGDMGKVLTNRQFMESLPVPSAHQNLCRDRWSARTLLTFRRRAKRWLVDGCRDASAKCSHADGPFDPYLHREVHRSLLKISSELQNQIQL